MAETVPIILTRHAVERAKERLRMSEAQLARLMGKIHRRGATREYMSANLMKWFDAKVDHAPNAMRESVIHMNHMFVIERGILITLYEVPAAIGRKALAAAKLNRENQG